MNKARNTNTFRSAKPTMHLLASTCFLVASAMPSHAEDLDFVIYNDTDVDLTEFNVSAASSNSWEENLISGGYVAPGYEIEIVIADGLKTCVYDLRGKFSDGSTAEDFGIDMCDLGEYTFTD